MIRKLFFTASVIALPIYLLLWLATYFLGSSTQCGDGFASSWPSLLAIEGVLFIAMYFGAGQISTSTFQKQIVLISNFAFLAGYGWLFVWVTLLGYQHCGAGELHRGYAQGIIRVWPILFISLHVVFLAMLFKKLKTK